MRIDAARVTRLCERILLEFGTPEADARIVAAHLTDSDLRGVRSHGVMRMVRYIEQIESGYIDNRAPIEITAPSPSLLHVDANRNFGILAFDRLIPPLAEAAQEFGIAGGAVVNCAHTGRVGAYSEAVADRFMWGLVFGGGGNERLKEVAPFGGARGVFDTNPYAASLPIGENAVCSTDFATSTTAQGKLLVYRTNRTPVPDGWIIDRDGRPTNDAEDFYSGGAMLPSAGAKGYGLALVAELFCEAALGPPHELNWFMVVVDLATLADRNAYMRAASRLRGEIESCPPREGFDRVRWPGQPEAEARAHQKSEGIDYSANEAQVVLDLEARFLQKSVE